MFLLKRGGKVVVLTLQNKVNLCKSVGSYVVCDTYFLFPPTELAVKLIFQGGLLSSVHSRCLLVFVIWYLLLRLFSR
jgi:hypothetical protein